MVRGNKSSSHLVSLSALYAKFPAFAVANIGDKHRAPFAASGMISLHLRNYTPIAADAFIHEGPRFSAQAKRSDDWGPTGMQPQTGHPKNSDAIPCACARACKSARSSDKCGTTRGRRTLEYPHWAWPHVGGEQKMLPPLDTYVGGEQTMLPFNMVLTHL